MPRRLYLDLDGVLADFDAGYERVMGAPPDRSKPDSPLMWERLASHGAFYYGLPTMPGAEELWEFVVRHRPIILTGLPESIPDAETQKRAWVRERFGRAVPVIACRSADKARCCWPGDVLVDDWEKYRLRWINAGGVWITHRSAAESIVALRALGFT